MAGADLIGAVFDNAILSEADLAGANLTNASFRDARLGGAVLDSVIGVEFADFEGACGSETTQLPLGLELPDCDAA